MQWENEILHRGHSQVPPYWSTRTRLRVRASSRELRFQQGGPRRAPGAGASGREGEELLDFPEPRWYREAGAGWKRGFGAASGLDRNLLCTASQELPLATSLRPSCEDPCRRMRRRTDGGTVGRKGPGAAPGPPDGCRPSRASRRHAPALPGTALRCSALFRLRRDPQRPRLGSLQGTAAVSPCAAAPPGGRCATQRPVARDGARSGASRPVLRCGQDTGKRARQGEDSLATRRQARAFGHPFISTVTSATPRPPGRRRDPPAGSWRAAVSCQGLGDHH